MLRRILILFLAFSLAALGLAFVLVPPYIIEITEAQIAEGVDENLPYTVNSGFSVTVQSAVVQLSDENKIVLEAQFDARGLTLEGMGTADVASSLRYENGRFYLSDLKHDNVVFAFSENSESTISDVRSTLEGILRRETEEAETSGEDDRIRRLAEANEYHETALREDALDLLDNVLGSFPIYDLSRVNDGRFRLAALALDDVEITSEKVLVTLSLQRFIITLAGILGTFLLFLVIILGPVNTILLSVFLTRLARGKSDDTNR
ncbi:hypothetical protein EU803_02300 [Loktanella sp. IMCC34160]|uniref:hypothetical protein n=1 Tax=Loktanella sp. IMCC34160 TaxID=2510646 RepID=UPI00101BE02B|nr:hypothetical protein [Loktanella sp. IMCC34160]RYG92960.1 hypothetical protein EU803_02300 [Loktanella sp. IMCC34160]